MSLDRDAAFLQEVPLFSFFSPDQIKLIAFNAQPRRITRGTTLFRPGERASSAIVVAAGEIETFRIDEDGESVVERLGPGAVLGETAVVVEIERAYGARAATDAEVMVVPRAVFRRVLEEYPETARRFQALWRERLHAVMDDLRAIAPRFSGD